MQNKTNAKKSPLFIIFTTVFLDLIGFGMVIPLVGIYGRNYGASSSQLAILGGIYSLMQFFFAPIWGSLSDRHGRRPILLMSLLGSTISYLIFGMAKSYEGLLLSRALGGIFAANISAAQAYIADVTEPKDRAKGMGLIGAAFGIGFTLGPPLGGISAAKIGLWAPGIIAASVCGLNFIWAIFRLPESLTKELRQQVAKRGLSPLQLPALKLAANHPVLWVYLLTFFLATFSFSMMEQTFSLLFQTRFGFDTGHAGYKTGLVLMFSGIIGAGIQGGWIRKLTPKHGENKLLAMGLALNAVGMFIFPYAPSYELYFLFVLPLTLGSSLINPSVSSLISRNATATDQGSTLGLSQGLGSLARAAGPFLGLLTFGINPPLPYLIAGVITVSVLLLNFSKKTIQRA